MSNLRQFFGGALSQPVVSSLGPESIGGFGVFTATTTFIALTANRAIYIPFVINDVVIATKLFWVNDATLSGNVDMGIYDEAGVRKVSSGSTLQAGASAPQSVDIADTTLTPGRYYFGFVADNATANFLVLSLPSSSVSFLTSLGYLQQAAAFPLPATATFAAITAATLHCPLIGFTVSPRTVI